MNIQSERHRAFTGSAIAVTISHNMRTAPRSRQRTAQPQCLGKSCSISAIVCPYGFGFALALWFLSCHLLPLGGGDTTTLLL